MKSIQTKLRYVDILNGSLERGDLKNYEIRIHAVKSNAKTIGALALGKAAEELELAAKPLHYLNPFAKSYALCENVSINTFK